ncbi:hypothetical protein Tsubulata_028264 [Turnera subulata]|uniref:F-box domain-containing protein n=1 Tax=Turnera subulata TaxID=218843 RepID=A0A9Q0FAU8_9ROSI|nr:hypothetical protein Tsubulata_028264 [Turnera subulata]
MCCGTLARVAGATKPLKVDFLEEIKLGGASPKASLESEGKKTSSSQVDCDGYGGGDHVEAQEKEDPLLSIFWHSFDNPADTILPGMRMSKSEAETIANKVSDFTLDCGDYGDHYEDESRSKDVGDQVDRLSNLPDLVLAHILSFMPIQDAVKTMQLRSFGSLWASIDNLDLNSCLSHDCHIRVNRDSDDFKFIDFVHQVLLLHQRSNIQRLHLSLRGLWRDNAIQNGYGNNHTEVLRRGKELADMCVHFAQLSLVYCTVAAPAGQIWMKSLQTLYLRQVWSDDCTIENLVSGCPLLEKLSLIRCYGLQKLNLASPNLKYLKFFHETDPEISVPNIKSLALASVSNLLRRTARNMEKIVFSPTPTPEYKKIFKSLPAASPRAVILFAIPE